MIILITIVCAIAALTVRSYFTNDEDYLYIGSKRWRKTPEGWKKCMLIGMDERLGHIWWFDGKFVWEQSRYTKTWWEKTDPGWERGFHLQGIMYCDDWVEWWKRNRERMLRIPKSQKDLESLLARPKEKTQSQSDFSRNRPPTTPDNSIPELRLEHVDVL